MVSWLAVAGLVLAQDVPQPVPGGYFLPNGWRITPVGRAVHTNDTVLQVVNAPDGRAVIALHSGYNPHGIVVIDTKTEEAVQRIPLPSSFLGLAWHPDGRKLYVSGGNASGPANRARAPIYAFEYRDGRLSETAAERLEESGSSEEVHWSGLAHHPEKDLLFAANRGPGPAPGAIAVFDTSKRALLRRIPVEIMPYDLELSAAGEMLYVSNWSSDTVSVIDTEAGMVTATISTCDQPNDLELSEDNRLFVACANDNTVSVIDLERLRVVERISTALYPEAPIGSTPNALAFEPGEKLLFVANADNYTVAVVDVGRPGRSEVLGFVPTGWYPSALEIGPDSDRLFVGNSKGLGSYANIRGPHSPLPPGEEGKGSVKEQMKGSVNIVDLAQIKENLQQWTRQVYENCPYNDELLARARPPKQPSIVPQDVGVGSVIRHVIYIIKENRTYDQVFGDFPQGNGDPRLTIFGRQVTPNHHAIAEQFVLFDNLYCDAEVSVDGHSWSNAAYATDFNEKQWPLRYGRHSAMPNSPPAYFSPKHIWDQVQRKGLTYRSYGEWTTYSEETRTSVAREGVPGLVGHVAPYFKGARWTRDPENAAEFIKEFDEYEKNFDSADPEKRLPNFIVMHLPEDHTRGTSPGYPTPRAMVASNDYAVGMVVDRVTHSKYWPETAIFVIQDDAQDGSDHVDARRTVGLVASPYAKRRYVDSTLYTTSSMLRTMELLLGLQPMSQFDAAATPMYAAFGTEADLKAFTHIEPQIDVNEMNSASAWGAKESLAMNWEDVDLTPMFELNEIIWKSVRGADSPMPPPVRSFHFGGR